MKKATSRIYQNILLLLLVIFVLTGCAVYITDTYENMEPDDKAYVHKIVYLDKELVDGYGTQYIGNFETNEAIFNGYGYYFEWDNEDLEYLSTFVTNGIVSWVPEHDAYIPIEPDLSMNDG